ncbi:MAG: solanesyl diphosphate synthase [Aphanocapsa lilacina HA4352-LM1]|jgi:all-trans-nonaprenyl-diphosphate synthase|uniref:Solanesyl diphosphate synthase n=1 Tax=Gloeobacter morelensis MG652769 TaxID=2781736 RepID=A0ABY3PPP1_9CYAN|nr:solanesyl diphosphate synthase [Gloeobacter morelensis]MBW4698064.1 solanesyl diphosphate synthase [Aphanocapsa lilacina HA4352-LM1]UFP95678.1 solanesyl diphosphate synthase [Gloeobacter morelensis MG652769]
MSVVSAANWSALVEDDLSQMTRNLKNLLGTKHPVLYAAAEHLFNAGGKRIRPALVLLVSRATAAHGEPTERHRRLAEITEMIHTASLVHDDVIDTSAVRRGIDTVNSRFGNRVAVLAGDYLFGMASAYLARLGSLEVVELLGIVISHFGEGELLQSTLQFAPDLTFEQYIDKSFYKTASLMAGTSRAAAVLSDSPTAVCEALYEYGRHLGIAFQVIDDLLDFTGSTAKLGKPAGSDLRDGNLTAPVLYALEESPHLSGLIERQFEQKGDLEKALSLIHASRALERTRELAETHARRAVASLEILSPSPAREALKDLVGHTVSRLY